MIQFPPPQPCNAPTSYQDGDGQLWLSPSPALPLTATLAERIATWRASPIANQSTWLDFNAQTCTISPSDHRERERKVSHSPSPVGLRRRAVVAARFGPSRRAAGQGSIAGGITAPKRSRACV